MFDFLIKTSTALSKFAEHSQDEVQKYASKQCKKTAVVCAVLGFLAGFVVKATLF